MAPSLSLPSFITGAPPLWAGGFGQDHHGYYADFSVSTGDAYWEVVTQRMRWIPPGTFLMGSPEDEPERWPDEAPQHQVTLTEGFWLAETTCTQELWTAVMSNNPSRFEGDQRPVEQVSFDDVEQFLSRLSGLVCGLHPRLPTEAQWEYACRAGTTGPFCFGDSITTDQANFDGNYSYLNTKKGVCRETTVDAKLLPRNNWGLYQMHGNVWEWCADRFGEYTAEPQFDPHCRDVSTGRVVRGGSWNDNVRHVRSACRLRNAPGNRSDDLGFRLLSSAGPVTQGTPSK